MPPPYDLKSAKFQKYLGSFIPDSRSECDVRIDMRMKNQVLGMQAGTSPNRINEENKFRAKSCCIYPFKQMIVRPDGTTAKCCNDPLTDVITGDLNTQTLKEVWHGKAYQEFRRIMYFDGRQSFKGCTFCDTFGLANYIPSPQAGQNEMRYLVEECRLRKNLGKIYIFDTSSDSMGLFDIFRSWDVEFDGFVNFRNEPLNQYYKFVDLDDVLAEHAFMMIPTPFYPDKLTDFLDEVGYQYGRDYLFYNYQIAL